MLRSIVKDPAKTALLIAAVAAATVAGAWAFEYAGYAPCKLCLEQRWPYYAAVPVALVTFASGWISPSLAKTGLAVLALIFAAGALLGAYHAGVEWKFWPGPTDCGGGVGIGPATVGDFLKDLGQARVVSCDDAAVRILGLSLAGWNVVISVALAVLAAASLRRAPGSR